MARGFYCAMLRGERVAWLAGPFDTREAAEARVPDARREHPSLFALPFGVLNAKLGLPTDWREYGRRPA